METIPEAEKSGEREANPGARPAADANPETRPTAEAEPILEAVPNFSEGRDLGVVRELVAVVESSGAEVLDWTADPDHHRSVITFVGDPATVEEAAVAVALAAMEAIDLRGHDGVHPRVGALDVLPFVPLLGAEMADAVRVARSVGARLADAGLPVHFYGEASDPPGRTLAELRRGGFEALQGGFPEGREPDLPAAPAAPHPTAGVTCVGARRLLLAWNLDVVGVEIGALRELAARLRETGGGFPGLRVLALELPRQGRTQISMNLEDPEGVAPFRVYAAVEEGVGRLGGRIEATEVVGMIPDALVLPAAADRLNLRDPDPSRLLSSRLAAHLAARTGAAAPGAAGSGTAVSGGEDPKAPQRAG